MTQLFSSQFQHFASVLRQRPHAAAVMMGSRLYPEIHGSVQFYQTAYGVLVAVEVLGLPASNSLCDLQVFGFHIHEGEQCSGNENDSFADVMAHYNPNDCLHPFHTGDLPPLFGNHGYAYMVVLTERFTVDEILGKTIIIHSEPDDFITQPAGNAGKKIACGEIEKVLYSSLMW